MNTHTILNIKTDKDLKREAQRIAKEIGVPLTTVMNAFLKQFVRDREITFSANEYIPNDYLSELIEEARNEEITGSMNGKELISHLRTL